MNDRLLRVPEYETLVALDGRLSRVDVEHLSWLGAKVPDEGVVVELGSYRGKSICAIGLGARMAVRLGVSLWSIDLWQKGANKTASGKYWQGKTWRTFLRQTEQMGLAVRTLKMSTTQARAKWDGTKIALLFIDAGHDYRSVSQDYQMWGPLVKPGGWIAFHDYTPRWPGVMKLIDKTVQPSGLWEEQAVTGQIWSARRK